MPATVFTPFPRDDFKGLIEKLLGFKTIWEGEKVPFVGPTKGKHGAYAVLDCKRVQKLGKDVIRYTWDPAAAGGRGANVVEIGGQRIYYVLIRINSFNDTTEPGYDPLESLRISLLFDSSQQTLQDMGVAYVNAGDVVPIAWNTDNRPGFAAVCEFQFGFAPWQSVTDDEGGIIEKINGGTDQNPVGDMTPTLIE